MGGQGQRHRDCAAPSLPHRFAVTPVLTLALIAPGCSPTDPASGESDTGSPPAGAPQAESLESTSDVTDSRLDVLRSLPYASGAARQSGERDGVHVRDAGAIQPGFTLLTIQPLSRAIWLDEAGQVRRRWQQSPSKVWQRSLPGPDGDLLAIGTELAGEPSATAQGFQLQDAGRYLVRQSARGELRWKRNLTVHHDVWVDGEDRGGPLVALTFERRRLARHSSSVDVRDDRLTWIDPATGEVQKHRSLLDAIDTAPSLFPLRPMRADRLGGTPWLDLLHANSVVRLGAGASRVDHPAFRPGNWLICFRHQDRVAIFDADVTRVLWSWGLGELSGPHDAQLLDDGRLLVFDNGLARKRSRVIEVAPLSGEIVWEYGTTEEQRFFTASKGSAQRLANGNTLIAESDRGRAFEVTRDGRIVWEYFCPYDDRTGRRASIVRARRLPKQTFD